MSPVRTALLLLGVVACGGDADGPSPGPSAGSGPVTATITPGGGTLTAVARDGSRLVLSIPEGAVRAPTDISIRPDDANGLPTFLLEPAGLVFARPFSLALTPAELQGEGMPMLVLAGSKTIPIPTVLAISDNTLHSDRLQFFGTAPDGTIPGGAAFSFARHRAEPDNAVGARRMTCDQIVSTAQAEFDGFLELRQPALAVTAALSGEAALQAAQCINADGILEPARTRACTELTASLARLTAAALVDVADFEANATEIMDWFAVVQALDAPCAVSPDQALDALEGEISKFINLYRQRLQELTGQDFGAVADLKEAGHSVVEVQAAAMRLGLPAAYTALENEALVPTVAALRQRAWSLCTTDGWHYPVSLVMPSGFFGARDIVGVESPRPGSIWPAPSEYAGITASDVNVDLQYCATDVLFEAYRPNESLLDSARAGRGESQGDEVTAISLTLPTEGTLELSGVLGAFTCWGGDPADARIDVILHGRVVDSLLRGGEEDYIGAVSRFLSVASMIEAAGITPRTGDTDVLILRRVRSGCSEKLWGPEQFDLATVTITFEETAQYDWTFDSDLDGWEAGAGGGAVLAASGSAVLRPVGPDFSASAWIKRTLDLPATVSHMTVTYTASCTMVEGRDNEDTRFRIRLEHPGGSSVLKDWTLVGVEVVTAQVALGSFAGQQVTIFIEAADEGGTESAPNPDEELCVDRIRLST